MSRIEDALKAANETCALRIGSEVLNEVAVMFKEQFPGKRAVVVADETTWDVAGKKVEEELKKAGVRLQPAFIFTQPDLYAEYSYIDLLVESLKEHDAIPVAVGSGTINDLTKLFLSSDRQEIYVCSHCGFYGWLYGIWSVDYGGGCQTNV